MESANLCLPGAPKIFAAIAGVINDIGIVSKDKINKQQGFKYRSIDDVYSVLNPALAKNRVFILPEILNESREIKTTAKGTQMICVILDMKYTVYAEDGSYIQTTLKGEAMDTGDKAINKAMAIAYKYLCFQLFCIPVEDMADPDADSHELKENKQPENAAPKNRTPASGKKKSSEEKQSSGQNEKEDATADNGDGKITEAMINTIRREQERTGVVEKAILARLHTKVKKIEDLTVEEFNQVMKIFQVTKDLKQEAADGDK